MVPRQILDTFRSERPSLVYCIAPTSGPNEATLTDGLYRRTKLAGSADSGFGAERLSRTGRSSTGLEVLHSSHQCRCELESRFRIPQLSQTKTSFLTRKKCYVTYPLLPSV